MVLRRSPIAAEFKSAICWLLSTIAVMLGLLDSVQAQEYPNKPIKIITSVSPGGVLDVFARAYADELQKKWKQPVIVDPRPGGNFTIAGRACATSSPDGYTLCFLTAETLVYSEFLNKTLSFDPRKDFAPVTNFFYNTMALVANASLGVKNLDELAALAKAKPKTLSYLAPAVPQQVFFERFNRKNGTDLVRVPFKGAGEAIPLMLSGTVPLAFFGSSSFLPFVRDGSMVVLAVDGPSYLYPGAKTIEELGYRGMNTRNYLGMVVPAGTPKAIIDRLYKVSEDILADPAFRQKHLLDRGMEFIGSTPEAFARFLEEDRIASLELVKEAGLKPE